MGKGHALYIVSCGAVLSSSIHVIPIASLWSCKTTQRRYYEVSQGTGAQNCLLPLENYCSQKYTVFHWSTLSFVCRLVDYTEVVAYAKPMSTTELHFQSSHFSYFVTLSRMFSYIFSWPLPLLYLNIYPYVTSSWKKWPINLSQVESSSRIALLFILLSTHLFPSSGFLNCLAPQDLSFLKIETYWIKWNNPGRSDCRTMINWTHWWETEEEVKAGDLLPFSFSRSPEFQAKRWYCPYLK